jgi:hypothetical protein
MEFMIQVVEELYCFLYESNDQNSWELWNSLYKGSGVKKVWMVPMGSVTVTKDGLPDMVEMVLLYLNNEKSTWSIENRLQVEVDPPRPMPTVIRVTWYRRGWVMELVHQFVSQINGTWVEIDQPPTDFVHIWGDVRQTSRKTMSSTMTEGKIENKKIIHEENSKVEDVISIDINVLVDSTPNTSNQNQLMSQEEKNQLEEM